MGDPLESPATGSVEQGWSRPQPDTVPRPTFMPAVTAVGVTCIFWGFVTSMLITLLGMVLFGIGVGGWIRELRNER